MTTKNKILIGALVVVAVLSLVVGCIFLGQKKAEEKTFDEAMAIYQEVLHTVAEQGKFTTDYKVLSMQMNEHLPEEQKVSFQDGALYCSLKDEHGRNLMIHIVSDNFVSVYARGNDGKIFTNDDVVLSVVINNNDLGYTVYTTSNIPCEHSFGEKEITQQMTCYDNEVTKRLCATCHAVETTVTNTLGHDFGGVIACGATAVCKSCDAPGSNTMEHVFTKMNTTAEYLAAEGTCAVKEKYYYACEYCNAKGTETFDGSYNHNNHSGSAKLLATEINEVSKFERLVCNLCDREIVSGVIQGYIGLADGQEHTLDVTSDVVVLYSLEENGEYTSTKPTFKNNGVYTVYYKIVKDDYELKSSVIISLSDYPAITVSQFVETSKSNPFLVEFTQYQISGIIADSNGIKVFTINDEPIDISKTGEWVYVFDLSMYQVHELHFYAVDYDGNEVELTHYVRFDYEKVAPELTLTPNMEHETIHVLNTSVVLSGYTKNGAKSMKINGNAVTIGANGYWTYPVTVPVHEQTDFIIEIVGKDNIITKKTVTVCHADIKPTFEIDSFDGFILAGTFADKTGYTCAGIQSLVVKGLPNADGIVCTNITSLDIVVDDTILVFADEGMDQNTISFELLLDQYLEDSFEIELTTTHGEHLIYTFHLIRDAENDNIVEVINLEIYDAVANKTTSQIIQIET